MKQIMISQTENINEKTTFVKKKFRTKKKTRKTGWIYRENRKFTGYMRKQDCIISVLVGHVKKDAL